MLLGLMSRWMTFLSWAYLRALDDLVQDQHGRVVGQVALAADQGVQGDPVHELLHDVVGGALLEVVVDVHDVLVLEVHHDAGFPLEALHELAGPPQGELLQQHHPVQGRVPGLVQRPHAALGHLGDELVLADAAHRPLLVHSRTSPMSRMSRCGIDRPVGRQNGQHPALRVVDLHVAAFRPQVVAAHGAMAPEVERPFRVAQVMLQHAPDAVGFRLPVPGPGQAQHDLGVLAVAHHLLPREKLGGFGVGGQEAASHRQQGQLLLELVVAGQDLARRRTGACSRPP